MAAVGTNLIICSSPSPRLTPAVSCGAIILFETGPLSEGSQLRRQSMIEDGNVSDLSDEEIFDEEVSGDIQFQASESIAVLSLEEVGYDRDLSRVNKAVTAQSKLGSAIGQNCQKQLYTYGESETPIRRRGELVRTGLPRTSNPRRASAKSMRAKELNPGGARVPSSKRAPYANSNFKESSTPQENSTLRATAAPFVPSAYAWMAT